MPTCAVASCNNPVHARGYCNAHYRRLNLNSDLKLHVPVRTQDPKTVDDFWNLVDRSPGPHACWLWQGKKNQHGYGMVNPSMRNLSPLERTVVAHRLAYLLAIGPIPAGHDIDHQCHTQVCTLGDACPHRACCNPEHLAPLLHFQNVLRGNGVNNIEIARVARIASQRAQTHCKHGHPFDAKNTETRPNGARRCKTCHKLFRHVRLRTKDTEPPQLPLIP